MMCDFDIERSVEQHSAVTKWIHPWSIPPPGFIYMSLLKRKKKLHIYVMD